MFAAQARRKSRRILFTIHTWLGLQLSIFFAFMFLTGSLLVIGRELESIAYPAVWTTIPQEEHTAGFGDIYKAIKSEHPGASIFVVTKRSSPWFVDRTFARTSSGEDVSYWTDPVTGGIVEQTSNIGFRNILRKLHDSLLTGKRSVLVLVSATSIPLLLQIMSGLVTYRRFWKGFFRRPDGTSGFRAWIGGTHRLMAVWATPVILITAVTSVYFMLGGLGLNGTAPQPGPPLKRETALPEDFDHNTINQAAAIAREALAGFEPHGMILPKHPSKGLVFHGSLPGTPAYYGPITVSVDPVTFDVLGAFTPDDNRGLLRWTTLMHMLHFGTWGGIISRVAWVILGLAATGTAITGALIFAARLAPVSQGKTGPLARIWRGLGFTRWLYVLLLLGIIATAYLRYGPG